MAVCEEKSVAVFSLEVPAVPLVKSMICRKAGVSMHKLSSGQVTRGDLESIALSVRYLQRANIFIDDTASQDIKVIKSKARRLKKQHGLDLILIDYLQLAKDDSVNNNRQVEISNLSSGLKALAKELNIPIIVLAQLNRAVENRKEQRPRSSDLRESGSIEQDADMIGLIYRCINKEQKEGEVIDESETLLIIDKNRFGPTGDIRFRFEKELTLFKEIEE